MFTLSNGKNVPGAAALHKWPTPIELTEKEADHSFLSQAESKFPQEIQLGSRVEPVLVLDSPDQMPFPCSFVPGRTIHSFHNHLEHPQLHGLYCIQFLSTRSSLVYSCMSVMILSTLLSVVILVPFLLFFFS